jgi:hypothetical protein
MGRRLPGESADRARQMAALLPSIASGSPCNCAVPVHSRLAERLSGRALGAAGTEIRVGTKNRQRCCALNVHFQSWYWPPSSCICPMACSSAESSSMSARSLQLFTVGCGRVPPNRRCPDTGPALQNLHDDGSAIKAAGLIVSSSARANRLHAHCLPAIRKVPSPRF